MPTLLISGVNGGTGIYRLDTETGNLEKSHQFLAPMGLTKGGENEILVADRYLGLFSMRADDLELTMNVQPRHTGIELHSVVRVGNTIYVVDTEKDSITLIDANIENPFIRGSLNVFTPEEGKTHHLNGLAYQDGLLYISYFSFDGGDITERANMTDGGISTIDIETKVVKEQIRSDLKHPHSVCFVDGEIFYAESSKRCVYKGESLVIRTPRYARGIAATEDFIFVGQSADRKDPADTSTGSVLVYTRDFEVVKEFLIPAEEIYDILVL